jgi:methionyl-tRNA formyltransferase
MRTVFMGSPDFALPTLEVLLRNSDLVGVVTQPDRRSGRGRKQSISAVKRKSIEYELPLIQPARVRDPEPIGILREWNPDLIVVAAYGQILSSELLEIPPLGSINVHASLLPRWRGAAPIQAAIYHGDPTTGVTLMLIDEGLDTGPIFAQKEIAIGESITAGDLSRVLAKLGADLLEQNLSAISAGEIQPQAQEDHLASFAPSLKKSDGHLDFSRPAKELCLQVRAYHPWPGSFFYWNDRRIGVHMAEALEFETQVPGLVRLENHAPAVATNDGLFVLLTIHPAGGKPMEGSAFLRGSPDFIGANLLK